MYNLYICICVSLRRLIVRLRGLGRLHLWVAMRSCCVHDCVCIYVSVCKTYRGFIVAVTRGCTCYALATRNHEFGSYANVHLTLKCVCLNAIDMNCLGGHVAHRGCCRGTRPREPNIAAWYISPSSVTLHCIATLGRYTSRVHFADTFIIVRSMVGVTFLCICIAPSGTLV